MVHVDGSVTTCCLDEHMENCIGNLRETPLSALWNGDRMNAWRRAHVIGDFAASGPLCPRCNWRSAGSYPDDAVEAWVRRIGDDGLLELWRARRAQP